MYICYNRKLNITLNFRFHMYEIFLKCDVTCPWTPPLSQTVTPSRTPPPSSVTYFTDGPQSADQFCNKYKYRRSTFGPLGSGRLPETSGDQMPCSSKLYLST